MNKAEQKTKRTTAKHEAASAIPPPLMTLQEIRELMELIAEKQFTEFELKLGDFSLRLKRGGETKVMAEAIPQAVPQVAAASDVAPAARTVETPPITTPASSAAAPAPAEEPL